MRAFLFAALLATFFAQPSVSDSEADLDATAREYSEYLVKTAGVMRPRDIYDDVERRVDTGGCLFAGCYMPRVRSFENEIVGRVLLLGILRPLVLQNKMPDDGAMREMANKVSKIFRENVTDDVKNDIAQGNWIMTSEAVNAIAQAAADIPTTREAFLINSGEHPTNSSFVHELAKAKDRGWRGAFVYSMAGLIRCAADHLDQLMPRETDKAISEEILEQKMNITVASCSVWLTGIKIASPAAFGDVPKQFLAQETIETYSSDENTLNFLKEYAVLIDTLKKSSSYASVDAFLNSVKRSERLYAATVWLREILKCKYKFLNARNKAIANEMGPAIVRIARAVLSVDVNPTVESLKPDVLKILRKLDQLNAGSREDEANIVGYLEQWEGCVVPKEARKHYDKFEGALKGPPEKRRLFLNELKKGKEQAVFALYSIVLDDISNMRRRPGLGDEAKLFFDKALLYAVSLVNSLGEHKGPKGPKGLPPPGFLTQTRSQVHKMIGFVMSGMSRRHRHRHGGRQQMEQLTRELRSSFRRLPPESKKQLIQHFPFRSIVLLSLLF